MLLIKNAEVYSPKYVGMKDILICNEKIELIEDKIEAGSWPCQVLDATGLMVFPGLIDQHIHVTGGGGEGGFHTRTPELQMSELIEGGITTVVGLLGTDGATRSVENLYAKTAALNEEGVTAFMLTGAYDFPGPTITGSAERDVIFIKEVLGQKLAISDHRSPNVSLTELIQIASKMRVAGMLSGKAGILTLHMGDAKEGLQPVFEAIDGTAIPIGVFRPTHVNRNPKLMEEGYRLLEMGGYVDLTCQIKEDASPGACILEALRRNIPTHRITISSDGHGSWSRYDEDGKLLEIGVSAVDALWKELRFMVLDLGMPIEEALPYMTSHVARALQMDLHKGIIAVGADADLLFVTKEMELTSVIARGQFCMKDKKIVKKGTYEK